MAEVRNPQGLNGPRKSGYPVGAVWPPVFWFALIWLVSSLPGKHLPAPRILSLDKLAHIAVYLILGLLVNRAVHRLGLDFKHRWWIYLVLLATAGLDELHQYLVPQRSVSFWDFAANATGLMVAFGAYWIFRDRS